MQDMVVGTLMISTGRAFSGRSVMNMCRQIAGSKLPCSHWWDACWR